MGTCGFKYEGRGRVGLKGGGSISNWGNLSENDGQDVVLYRV